MKLKALVLVFMGMAVLACPARGGKSIYEWAFIDLDYARKEKVRGLKAFWQNLHRQALELSREKLMLDFFDIENYLFTVDDRRDVSAKMNEQVEILEKQVREIFVTRFFSFYDILFVNRGGDVFFTFRKESDYSQNIHEGSFAGNPLSQFLQAGPEQEGFVDFHDYPASNKPAAFIVEPAFKDGRLMGWFVMQCPGNKINSLFAGGGLGMTGEVVLVNEDGFLLTESGFVAESTILRMKLDDRNIRPKFEQGSGHRTVTDYRGFTAMTSFEVVEFMGARWLVVAKCDRSQVITDHYRDHADYYFDRIVESLSSEAPCVRDPDPPAWENKKAVMVDIDEFLRAEEDEILQTVGVSTCTALIAAYPGRFGYMAHISPYDRVYGRAKTDLLGHITERIKHYDIFGYQRQGVRFIAAAGHFESLRGIIDKLLDEGFLLSQIYFLHHPGARTVGVMSDYTGTAAFARWKLSDSESVGMQPCEQHNLEHIVERFIEK